MAKKRDYKKEYKRDHSSKAAKKARARRNRDRAEAVKDGRVKKGDGKEVDHPAGNAKGKTRILSRRQNRINGNKARARKGK